MMRAPVSETTVRDIEKAFVRLLRDNLYGGEELVLIEPFNGPRPAKPYASVTFISSDPEQHEVYKFMDDPETGEYIECLRGERYCRLRVQFWNSGAKQAAVDCQNLLRSHRRYTNIEPITGFGYVGPCSDMSGQYMGKFEERASMDVEVYALMRARYPIDHIDFVSGVIVHDGDKEEPYKTGGDRCKLTFGNNMIKEKGVPHVSEPGVNTDRPTAEGCGCKCDHQPSAVRDRKRPESALLCNAECKLCAEQQSHPDIYDL